MADIPSTYTIFAAGDYVAPPMVGPDGQPGPGLTPGVEYILTLKTSSPTDSTATISFNNGVSNAFVEADNPGMLGATEISERRFLAPSTRLQINLADDFTEVIKVTLVEKKK